MMNVEHEIDDDTRRRYAAKHGVTPDRVGTQLTSQGYVPWIDWESMGRERYYDTPDDARGELVSVIVRRSKRPNGEPAQYHEGVIAEHNAHRSGRALACGKSMRLHDALECECDSPLSVDACPCELCTRRR